MSRYKGIIAKFRNKKVLVVGDLILDQHIQGQVLRISPEAPVPVVLQEKEPTFSPGGAANVANNLKSLGARVTVLGRVGADAEGRLLVGGLQKRRILTNGVIVDRSTPTIVKTRIMAQHQQVLRLDREKSNPVLDKRISARIVKYLEKNFSRFDAVIFSDYGKGLITRELVEAACSLAVRNKKILTVDPKVEHFAYYRGVTAITPNRKEAENAIRNIKITQSGRRRLTLTSDRLLTLADVDRAGRQLLKFMELNPC